MSEIENVVIIGSGPAGFTAGIYAARAALNPLMIEGEARAEARDLLPGGQLMLTTDVENFPGFPEGIRGADLMDGMRGQAKRFGLRVEPAWVDRIDFSSRPFRIHSGDREWKAKSMILATGASARWLGLDSEIALRETGYVSACATCDGAMPHFRNRHLAVIGGGDSALEEANFLTRFASRVTVVHRRDQLRASKAMQDKARNNPKIAFQWDVVVSEVLDVSQKKVTGLRLKDTKTGGESVMECDGLFVAIGHTPATALFRGALDLDDAGYLRVHDGTHTSVEGVFGAGDCVDHDYRQAITAAGMGCMAAIDCERWLES